MARKKKKKPAADASAEAGESGETPDVETVDPSAAGTDVVTRNLAPIDVRQADPHPAEVHLSLEPEAVGPADPAGAPGATSTRARDPEPASVEDVALELRDEGDGEKAVARGGIGDASAERDAGSDDSDAPRDEHGDEADDEDHGESRADRARRHRRPPFSEITEEGVSEDALEADGGRDDSKHADLASPAESPTRSPRSSDTSGAFAAVIRSPAAFLKGLSFSTRKDKRGDQRDGATRRTKSFDGDAISVLDAEEDERAYYLAKRERKRDKRRAKKARRRLKRLVHAANTMGSTVSAKEQTTTQLALCMQLGLTMSLRGQKTARSFAAVSDASLAETDVAKTLEVSASNVEDGSKLPSFRFVTHAPSRFERVRSAWGLSLPNYAESFALEMRVRNGDRLESRDAKNAEKNALPTASKEGTTPRHARDFSVGSSEGAGALSLTDEGADSEGLDGISDDDERDRATRAGDAPPRAFSSYGRTVSGEETETALPMFAKRVRDGRTNELSERFSVVSQEGEFVCDENASGADGLALRPEVFLPSRTSLRIISSANASGKSSSWFFCSKDSRFLVKTCTLKERDVLLDILGEYSRHAETYRGTSLLPQYYGLYTIEVGSKSAHFIIMNYWFATMHEITTRFDLKGSTKGRRASKKEKAKGDAAVLKDLDFLESSVRVETPMAEEVKAAIATDVAFMERNRLIDYSMMVGLHFYDDAEGGDGDGGGDGARGDGDRDGANEGRDENENARARRSETSGDGDGGYAATSAEENGAPAARSPGGRRRGRPGYGSFGGSNGGTHTGRDPLANVSVSDAERSAPSTPARGVVSPRGTVTNGDGGDDGEKTEPDVSCDALFETGPFAEPAADDTRLQFQLRALETPFGLAYLGIIDILTQYGAAKVAENLCFGTLACGADISCQPPDRYARRFKRFIDAHVLKVGPETEDQASGPGAAPLEMEASGESGTN